MTAGHGDDHFPASHPPTTSIAALRKRYEHLTAQGTGERVGITGRVLPHRIDGRLCLATVWDASGDIQIVLSPDRLGVESLESWRSNIDLGDQVAVAGEVMTSPQGECAVLADRWSLTSKCLRPQADSPVLGVRVRLRLILGRKARR